MKFSPRVSLYPLIFLLQINVSPWLQKWLPHTEMKQLALFQGLLPEFISQLWRKIFLCNVVFKMWPEAWKKSYWVIIINSEVVSIYPCTNYIVIRLQLHLLPHLNLLITSGKIPENVNIAGDSFVLPLQGQMVLTWNFPGTSLLPVISKVVERHIHTLVHDNVSSKHLLSDNQFGFQKCHSTIMPFN